MAFRDEERWEQVRTGATGDLFQEGPLGSQAMIKRIADFANGSEEPQPMTLFQNIEGKFNYRRLLKTLSLYRQLTSWRYFSSLNHSSEMLQ